MILKSFANDEEKAKKKKSQVVGSDSTAADLTACGSLPPCELVAVGLQYKAASFCIH